MAARADTDAIIRATVLAIGVSLRAMDGQSASMPTVDTNRSDR